MRKPNPIIVLLLFIIHLKTSETYKTIKRSLLVFQVYLFYFRALFGLSFGRAGAWTRQRPMDASSIQKKLLLDLCDWMLSTSAAEIT